MELIAAPSHLKGSLLRRDIEESLRVGSKVALVSFEGYTLRMLGEVFGRERNLLLIDATLSGGIDPLLMLAHLLGRYDGFIDEVYGPYAVSLSISNEFGSARRKFLIAMNLLRFLERQIPFRVRAYTSFTQLDAQFMRIFDKVTFVR